MPKVGLGRLQGRPVRLGLEPVVHNRDDVGGNIVPTELAQELLDDALALLVAAFSELVVTDPALGVHDVQGRPIPVAERPPDRVVVVQRSG